MERPRVVRRRNRDGGDSELAAGSKDAHGDLASVGHEQSANGHPTSLPSMPESHAGRLVDGTNVEAVYHGPAERSGDSFVFAWEAPS